MGQNIVSTTHSYNSPKSKSLIWVIDNDLDTLTFLKVFFESHHYSCLCFSHPLEATKRLENIDQNSEQRPDLVLSDLNMPQINGLEITQIFRAHLPHTPVLLMTAHATLDSAIESLRQGVSDYLKKPLQTHDLELAIQRAFRFKRLEKENEHLRQEIKSQWRLGKMIGKSHSMKNVFDLITRVANATANVLISGESGTGKELVAQAIHQLGPRSQKPFVAINCSAIPDELLESELFGHARGSFTGAYQKKKGLFEEAHGGTLFLDEIGDMNLPLQAKLLRVLQDHKIRSVGDNQFKDVDVRVVAATHKDLKEAIQQGTFREDLFYRLSVIPIVIPPLRGRREDIPLLADYFLAKYSSINKSEIKGFTKCAIEKLMHLPWHGNVRELENLVERLVVLNEKSFIEASDIPNLEESPVENLFSKLDHELPTMAEVQKRYLDLVLEKTQGKKEKAAQILGLNRRTLYRKEKESINTENNAKH